MSAPFSGPPSVSPIAEFLNLALAPPSGNGADIGFVTGTVQSWDEISGTNTVVLAGGVTISNLKSIQPGLGIQLQPGDIVGLKRVGNSYLVEGRIVTPGQGNSNQIRSASVATFVNGSTPAYPTYGDLPGSFGPEITSVYVGSSRRALVFVSSVMLVNSSSTRMSFAVSGSSSISPPVTGGRCILSGPATGTIGGLPVIASVCTVKLLTAADGLNQGFNTFTAKYNVENFGPGTGGSFQDRNLTVIPF